MRDPLGPKAPQSWSRREFRLATGGAAAWVAASTPRLTAAKFDADAITDLAFAAGMRYVNLTTRHHDSFCRFATRQTDFNRGPLPDGSVPPAHARVLREIGARLRREGFPAARRS